MHRWKNALAMAAMSVTMPALASEQVSGANAQAVIAATRQVIHDRYVLPDIGAALERALSDGEKAGHYNGLVGEALAVRISADLDAVAHDRHLSLRYDPHAAAMLREPRRDADANPQGMARAFDRMNAGVRELRTLPGNIRYMAYDGFVWDTPGAAESLATAMRFLHGGDAYIIDIRRNGGGSPDAVATIASYFLAEATPLMRFELRGQAATSTHAPKAPFSLTGKPLYVLISENTASAAEEFSTHVKAFGFGTLVGANTSGAGFRNDMVPLPSGYVLSVSVGRAMSHKTGRDWEKVGVAPDIAVPAETALPRAQEEAMARIAASAPADERAGDDLLLGYYRALAHPVALVRPASDYAGRYADRTVIATAEGLTIGRDGRPRARLIPVAPDSFASEADPAVRVTFNVVGSTITSIRIVQNDGSASTLPRSG